MAERGHAARWRLTLGALGRAPARTKKLLAAVAGAAATAVMVALVLSGMGRGPAELAAKTYRLGVSSAGKYVVLVLTSDRDVHLTGWEMNGARGGLDVVVPGRGAVNVTLYAPWRSGLVSTLKLRDSDGNTYTIHIEAPDMPMCRVEPLGAAEAGGYTYYVYRVLFNNKASRPATLALTLAAVPGGLPGRALIVALNSSEAGRLAAMLRAAGVHVVTAGPGDAPESLDGYGIVYVLGGVWPGSLAALHGYLARGGRVVWVGPPPGVYVYEDGAVRRSGVASPDIALFGEHLVDEVNATMRVNVSPGVYGNFTAVRVVGVMAHASPVVARAGGYIVGGAVAVGAGRFLYLGLARVRAETVLTLTPFVVAGPSGPAVRVETARVGPYGGVYRVVYVAAPVGRGGGAVLLARCGGATRTSYIGGLYGQEG